MRNGPLQFIITHKNLALLLFVLYCLYVECRFYSYDCYIFRPSLPEISLFILAFMMWLILIVVANIAISIYDNLIEKIDSNEVKKVIDVFVTVLLLFMLYSFFTI